MKFILIVSAVLAVTVAAPGALLSAPATIITAQSPILSQYHSQDALGQYAYGYNGGLSAKVESKSLDGVTRGSYSYVDAEGLLQTIEYTADALNGFRAAATNLPKAPIDNNIAPEPVRDTPEVALAKAEHLKAYNEAAIRAAAEPENPAQAEYVAAPLAQYQPAQYQPAQYQQAQYQPAQIISLRQDNGPASFAYTIAAPWIGAAPQFINSPIIAARAAPLSLQLQSAQGPQDTPEVAQARAEHFAAVEEQKARISAAGNQ